MLEKASLESQIALAAAARDANQTLAVLEASLSGYSKFMDSVLATGLSENNRSYYSRPTQMKKVRTLPPITAVYFKMSKKSD